MTLTDGRSLPVNEVAFSKAVLDNMADAVSVNVGLTRVYVNEAYLQLFGLNDRSEAVERQIDEHMSVEHRKTVRERTLASQNGSLPPGLHSYRIIRPNGEARMIEAKAVAVTYEGQAASLAILRDVTERAEQEATLRAALSLNAATLESTADGILVVNGEGIIVNYNAKFAQMWGLESAVLDAPTRDRAIAHAAKQLNNPEPFSR
jgi:PAS domain S-box-containing protein